MIYKSKCRDHACEASYGLRKTTLSYVSVCGWFYAFLLSVYFFTKRRLRKNYIVILTHARHMYVHVCSRNRKSCAVRCSVRLRRPLSALSAMAIKNFSKAFNCFNIESAEMLIEMLD